MLVVKDTDKGEWCIVCYHNKSPQRKADQDLIVRRVYQWEAVGRHLQSTWEIVARGFKSNEEALQFVNLFKE